MSLSSKRIGWLEGVLHKESVKICFLEVSNLTKKKKQVLDLKMLCNSKLIVEETESQD